MADKIRWKKIDSYKYQVSAGSEDDLVFVGYVELVDVGKWQCLPNFLTKSDKHKRERYDNFHMAGRELVKMWETASIEFYGLFNLQED
jgi:hypothetical protein